jgi:hypothetical protein
MMNYGNMISDIEFPPTLETRQVFYWGDVGRLSILYEAIDCAIVRHTKKDE